MGCVLLILCAGCGTSQTDRPPDHATTISSGGYTWVLGEVMINGTNVPASQLRVTAVPSTNAPPQAAETAN